jgi:hypothetical protein
MATSHEVKLGDKNVELHPFKGFKATEMLTQLAAIYDEVPDLEARVDAFVRKHAAENTVKVPRAYFEAEYSEEAKRVSEEAWAASGNVMELPGAEPSLQRVVLTLFPDIIKLARRRAFDLLALAICPNSELAELDIDDGADKLYGSEGALSKYRKQLLHEAEAQQLFALAAGVVELLKDQFAGDGDDGLGKLKPLVELVQRLLGQEPAPAEPEPPKTAAPNSSSSSPKRSKAGAAKKSSTASRGGKSAASVAS